MRVFLALAVGLLAVGCGGGGGSDPVTAAQAGGAGHAGSGGAGGSSAGVGGAGAAGAAGGGTGGALAGSAGSAAGAGGSPECAPVVDYRHCMGSNSCNEQCDANGHWSGVCECGTGGAAGMAGAIGGGAGGASGGSGAGSGGDGQAGMSGGGSAGASGTGGSGGDPDCAPSNIHPLPMKCSAPTDTRCGYPGNATLCTNTGKSAICPDGNHQCALWTGNDYSVCSDGRISSCPTGTCGYGGGCYLLENDNATFCPCVFAGVVMP